MLDTPGLVPGNADQIDDRPRPASYQCLQRRDPDPVAVLRQLEHALIFGRQGLKTACQIGHKSNNFTILCLNN